VPEGVVSDAVSFVYRVGRTDLSLSMYRSLYSVGHVQHWHDKDHLEMDLHNFSRGMAFAAIKVAIDEAKIIAKNKINRDLIIITGRSISRRSKDNNNNDEDDDGPELHNFNEGHIVFSKKIIDDIKRLFSIRESYVLNVIAEWYDDNYTTKFGEEMGHPEIEVSYCESYDFKGEICPGEVEVPEKISDREMMDFIRANSDEYSDVWLHDAWSHDLRMAYEKVAYKLKTQNNPLSEMIKLDINVGDTVMGGKFKNKKVIVKTIGKNEKGEITINGKPLLRFRILKEGKKI
jgi:hypothetical protein